MSNEMYIDDTNRRNMHSIQWILLIGIVLGRYTELLCVLIVAYIILKIQKYQFKLSKIHVGLIIIFFLSFFLILSNGYKYDKFFQQAILLAIYIICYYQFFFFAKQQIPSLFNKYIQLMYVLCILGLIQFTVCLLFQIDIFPFTLDGYVEPKPQRIMRIHSILAEAGNLGTCLVPVIAYVLLEKDYFKENKKKTITIVITYLLTFATISYVLLAIILLVKVYIKLRNAKYVLIGLMIFIIPYFIGIMTSNTEDATIENTDFLGMIQKKIVQSLTFQNDITEPNDFESLNASSYALLTNLWVSINAPSRLIGTGLGTHQENYYNTYSSSDYYLYGLNSQDAYSLLIRMFSEFGIIGLFIYFTFILRHFNPKNIINICVLFLLISVLIRGGNYVIYGTIMFHFMYYYTSKHFYKSDKLEKT